MEPDAVEIRVLGCLLEKQRITPDIYPLTLNSLRLACNQASNRDPVVAYEEPEIGEAVRRLMDRGWVALADDLGRVRKYRHLLVEALDLGAAELSVLAVLMLRGEQTPGQLKQRSERLYGFGGLGDVYDTLERLLARGQVVRHTRRRGQKEDRYEQRLGYEVMPDEASEKEGKMTEQAYGSGDGGAAMAREESEDGMEAAQSFEPGPSGRAMADGKAQMAGADPRIDWLEAEVVKLRAQLAALREALGE